ncbi:MAG: AhpC/TSA family protein [Cyclobacteriaceae bacterium]
MKKVKSKVAILLVLIIAASCGESQEGIPIVGTVSNPEADQLVLFQKYGEAGLETIDTIEVSPEGKFEHYVKITEPSFLRINFYNKMVANLILNGTETNKIEIALDAATPTTRPTISGSKETDHLAVFDRLIDNMREDQKLIESQNQQASLRQDEAEMKALSNEFFTLLDGFYDEVKAYSHKIKPSLAVFYGIGTLKVEDHFEFYDSLSNFYNKELPGHVFTKNLTSQVEAVRGIPLGSIAPEISLPTPDGDILTLSSLRGNYVLVDFWAAWCRPCRMENPNVVRVYNQYKDKNFEILGVSLDRDRKSWVNAIESDGLEWLHVSDLKYFRSQAAGDYKINAIPATYLIDPEGRILVKGLRGASLEAKLKEIFG